MVFVLVQDFIHSRLPLYICGAVIGRKVAKSISEMALRLQHHHRRYLIESTCKMCVGVSSMNDIFTLEYLVGKTQHSSEQNVIC